MPNVRAISTHFATWSSLESQATLIPRFLLAAVAASIVYGEIRIMTDSVWPAWLMHTSAALVAPLIFYDLIEVSSGLEFLFAPVLEGGLMIVLFTSLGVGIYLLRRKRSSEA